MVYKYHKEPHELFSNRARLKEPTEEQKKWILERREKSKEAFKRMFPEIDLDAITLKSKK